MNKLLIEIFGTQDEKELRKIAEKAKKYDMLFQTEHAVNLRNAGRKPVITEEDMLDICKMKENGMSVQKIADMYETTRQTIYKYLELSKKTRKKEFVTMRMNYMYKDEVCTVIDIDFMHEKIYIENKVDNLLHRAFGVIEKPTWKDFEEFMEERCFPRERACLKEILRDLGLTDYDPLQIIEKTKGVMAEDYQWIDIVYL